MSTGMLIFEECARAFRIQNDNWKQISKMKKRTQFSVIYSETHTYLCQNRPKQAKTGVKFMARATKLVLNLCRPICDDNLVFAA